MSVKSGIKYGKLKIVAGKATPAPPITPCLGQRGINIRDFCSNFNSKSVEEFGNEKLPLQVDFSLDKDTKKLNMRIRGPSVTDIIMDYFSLKKGGSNISHESIGNISQSDAEKIAVKVVKYQYMNTSKVDSIARTVISIAKSIGMKYVS